MSDDLAFREKKRVHTFLGRGVVEFRGGTRRGSQKGASERKRLSLFGDIPH